MSSNKNDNELAGLGLTPKGLRQDLILFKEEVLKDIKVFQKEFTYKFNKMEETLKTQINVYESKVSNFEQRIKSLSNSISSDKAFIQKVEELVKFKEDTNDKLLTESIRLTNLETDFKTNIKNIESILSNSVIYPRVIGYSAKFKNFHDFIDYVLIHISDLDLFKEKNIHDLGPYKKKIDDSIEFVKLQVNHIVGSANEFTIKSVNDAEHRMKTLIQLYDDRLQDTRVENANYSIGLKKKSEQLSRLIENIYEVKKDIYKKLNDEVKDMKVEQRQLGRYFTSYKKQFTLIRDKFAQLSEFIRDVRFRANLAPDGKKRDFVNMAKQMDFRNNLTNSYNSLSKKKNSEFSRAYTSDMSDIFESPEPYSNNILSKSLGISKRNSVQVGFNSFSNKLSDKFNLSSKKQGQYKNSVSGNLKFKKSLTKNINIDEKSDFLDIDVKQNTLNRRNTTAIVIPNKLNKEFSQFNRKNSNFDFYNFKKEKDENSLSISSSEDNNDNDKEKNKNRFPSPTKKPIIKGKNQYIIKEEDENNNSEITEDNNNKKKKSKEIKINKEEDKRNSQINNNKRELVNNQIKIENEKKNINEKILNLHSNNSEEKKESKENKDDAKKNKDNKVNSVYKENSENKKNNEIEKEKKNDNEKEMEKNNQNIKELKEKLINKENDIKIIDEKKGDENKIKNNNKFNINKIIISPNSDTNINSKSPNTNTNTNINKNINKNITGPKVYNKKDNVVKLQEFKNEISQKDKERNNTLSIVNINDMFMKSNFNEQRNQFMGTANNYFFAYTPEYEYKKQYIQTVKSTTAKNSPTIPKFNSGKSSSKSFNKTKDSYINRQYEQYNEMDNLHYLDINNSDQAYKTFTSFPKIQYEGIDKKRPNLNRKIIVLSSSKNKRMNDANNAINKRVGKVSLNKKIDPYNYIKRGISPPL